jgi:hypothetical protein
MDSEIKLNNEVERKELVEFLIKFAILLIIYLITLLGSVFTYLRILRYLRENKDNFLDFTRHEGLTKAKEDVELGEREEILDS